MLLSIPQCTAAPGQSSRAHRWAELGGRPRAGLTAPSTVRHGNCFVTFLPLGPLPQISNDFCLPDERLA